MDLFNYKETVDGVITKEKNMSSSSGGIGFAGLLTVVFITLKLTGYIAWSWWWVLCPLWAGFAIGLGFLVIIGILALFGVSIASIMYWLTRS